MGRGNRKGQGSFYVSHLLHLLGTGDDKGAGMSLRATGGNVWLPTVGIIVVSQCDKISVERHFLGPEWSVHIVFGSVWGSWKLVTPRDGQEAKDREKGINPQHPFQVSTPPMTYLSSFLWTPPPKETVPHFPTCSRPLSNLANSFQRGKSSFQSSA